MRGSRAEEEEEDIIGDIAESPLSYNVDTEPLILESWGDSLARGRLLPRSVRGFFGVGVASSTVYLVSGSVG